MDQKKGSQIHRSTENIKVLPNFTATFPPPRVSHSDWEKQISMQMKEPEATGKIIRTNRIHSLIPRTEFVGNDIT